MAIEARTTAEAGIVQLLPNVLVQATERLAVLQTRSYLPRPADRKDLPCDSAPWTRFRSHHRLLRPRASSSYSLITKSSRPTALYLESRPQVSTCASPATSSTNGISIPSHFSPVVSNDTFQRSGCPLGSSTPKPVSFTSLNMSSGKSLLSH